MALLLLLVMLTACSAIPQDLSGKMFTFPQETKTAHVRVKTSKKDFNAVTVCLRSITDLTRNHALFSLATPSAHNAFLIWKTAGKDQIDLYVRNCKTPFGIEDYKLNTWHPVCSTWDSASGVVQLWFDGKASIRKFVGGSKIRNSIVILGQDQDTHGGRFVASESFVGMLSDVHMWDYVLSPSEIQRYVDNLYFTPGNVINWKALDFQITGRVLIEDEQLSPSRPVLCR